MHGNIGLGDKTRPGHAILDARLWIRLDFDHAGKANTFTHTNPELRGHLARQLLLYDQLVVPTHDYGVVPIFIAWMGPQVFRRLVESRSLVFLRIREFMGYSGQGFAEGLQLLTIEESDQSKFTWDQRARFGRSIPEVIDLQLKYLCPAVGKHDRSMLVDLVESQTAVFDPPKDVFARHVRDESYEDILQSPELSAAVGVPQGTGRSQMSRLPGVKPGTILSLEYTGAIRSGIDIILAAAEINAMILAAVQGNMSDLVVPEGSEAFLRNKLARAKVDPSLLAGFQRLLDVSRLPDVGMAVAAGDLTLQDICKIRDRRRAVLFREWLRLGGTQDPDEISRLFVEALERKSWVESLPFKSMKFLVTSLVGTTNPLAGKALSGVSLFADRWLKGYSPKMFIDELRRLPFAHKRSGD